MEDEVICPQSEVVEQPPQGESIAFGVFLGLFTSAIIAVCIWGATVAPRPLYTPQKHTGPVQVVAGDMYHGFVMHRPNDEEFIMKFDSEVGFCFGLKFKDITYTDESRDIRHFIKATLDKKEAK